MSGQLMIYGPTGYTGRLITSEAAARGLRPVLCGRNEAKLAALAEPLGLEYRVARLTESGRLDAVLRDIHVVLHAAGPFAQTWRPMVDACLRTGTHYLDISGELPVIEAMVHYDSEARKRKVMIMPAVGFEVVPSDCLAAHVARRLRGARRVVLGLTGFRFATRGSAKSFLEQAGRDILVRRDGAITSVAPGSLQREFDYGDGPRPSFNFTWGDVVCAYYTTGIPNIEVYFEATPIFRGALMANRYFGWLLPTAPWQAWLKLYADLLPEGPSETERAAVQMVIVAEAEDARGRRVCSRLHTPQAYTFTGVTAPAIARAVLRGDIETGFQTPGRVYGADFVLSFANVSREDVE